MERNFLSGLCPILRLGNVHFCRDPSQTDQIRFLGWTPRFIRVKWYSRFERLDCEDGELEANVPLDSSGCLSLTRIENMWGMDRCIVRRVAPDRV